MRAVLAAWARRRARPWRLGLVSTAYLHRSGTMEQNVAFYAIPGNLE